MPHYPTDAACGRSELPPSTWDHSIAGETDEQRKARWNAAAAVCVTCPITDDCATRRSEGGGVRAGVAHPDKVPGWTLTVSNLWFGLSRQGGELHGNEAGYKRHVRDGTRPCYACLRGYAAERRTREQLVDVA